MADIDLAWNYFKNFFFSIFSLALINKHAALRRFRVRGKDNPWFNTSVFLLPTEKEILHGPRLKELITLLIRNNIGH